MSKKKKQIKNCESVSKIKEDQSTKRKDSCSLNFNMSHRIILNIYFKINE